jgi:hypothetical protein
MRLVLFALIAWPLPAVIAGALGWRGVWGSGSALVDYLIPIPVAGGVLHVPWFVLAGSAVAIMPSLGTTAAAWVRALLVGMALAGVLLLLRLDELWLAWRTGATFGGSPWQQNPIGLFLLSDATLALLFTLSAPQRPRLRADFVSAALVVVPMLLPVSMSVRHSPAGEAFLPGQSLQGPAYGDRIQMVYTRLDPTAPGFKERAEQWIAPMHPRQMMDNDDTAFLFTRSLDAARRFEMRDIVGTLCVYEDDTASYWLIGSAADGCFDTHVSFTEKFAQAYASRSAGEPQDVRDYLARQSICAGIAGIPASGDTGGVEISSMRICSRLPEKREALRAKYPDWATRLDAPA